MAGASSLCFGIMAFTMCMNKRFGKHPECPEVIGLESIWIEGAEKTKEQTEPPASFDKTKETVILPVYNTQILGRHDTTCNC